jgi:2-polyprenyl-6-methoxyphenol hydroxylase-like FAD-dependent oxidoreductase
LDGYEHRDKLTYISHTKPGRQIARIALRDEQTSSLFMFTKDFLLQQPIGGDAEETALREIYKEMGWEADAILSRMNEVSDIYFDRVSQIRMVDWTKGTVALLGDTAACASLLAGRVQGWR